MIDFVRVLDTRETLATLRKSGLISKADEEYIATTQFRSYEFSPRVAAYLLKHGELPGTDLLIEEIAEAPEAVWFIDNFGNCKTTLIEQDIEIVDGAAFLAGQYIKFYARLKDIPNGELGVVIGSSGPAKSRFLEIMLQGGSAAKRLGVGVGSRIREN